MGSHVLFVYTYTIYMHLHTYTYTCGTYIYIIAIYLGLPPYTHSPAYTCSMYSHHFHAHAPQNTFSRYVQTCINHLYHLDDRHTYALISMHVNMPACIFSLHMPTFICIYVPQARSLQAVPRLVKLFNHANQEVQRHATGAMRNLIYDNADNKLALVEENGIFELLRTLREQDDELRKDVTGTLVPPTSSFRPHPLPSPVRSLLLLSFPSLFSTVCLYLMPSLSHTDFLGGCCLSFLLFLLFISTLCICMHATSVYREAREQLWRSVLSFNHGFWEIKLK